jgi:DNA-binding GntR family transcriptional regulator
MITRRTIGAEVYDRLRHDIIRLAIKPGETLSEADVAKRFAVSRQPVREAFIHLADDGFLLIRPQRPTVVKPISVAAVMNAQFIREAIETSIVLEAAPRWTAADATTLAELIGEQQSASAAKDRDRFHALDEAFHREIATRAGRAAAWHAVDQQKAEMDRLRFLSLEFGAPRAIEEHRAIAAALAVHDAGAAAAAMRVHLSAIKSFIGAIQADHAAYFAEDL